MITNLCNSKYNTPGRRRVGGGRCKKSIFPGKVNRPQFSTIIASTFSFFFCILQTVPNIVNILLTYCHQNVDLSAWRTMNQPQFSFISSSFFFFKFLLHFAKSVQNIVKTFVDLLPPKILTSAPGGLWTRRLVGNFLTGNNIFPSHLSFPKTLWY